jgi:hypothetical protein
MKNKRLDKPEVEIQRAWNNIQTGYSFVIDDGALLKVFSPGTWNVEDGPDFINAKISINGKVITGPIEVHRRASDWMKHNHNSDAAYNNVILHVVGVNDLSAECAATLPQVFVLPRNVKSTQNEKYLRGNCADYFFNINSEQLLAALCAAGIERFYAKSERILKEMVKSGVEKYCMRLIFEAAGYKRNRDSFVELFERFYEYPVEIRKKSPSAILWGESGLLPDSAVVTQTDEMRQFTDNIWREWWRIRIGSRPGINWKRLSRPANSPERRIAAIIELYQRFGENPLQQISQLIFGYEDKAQIGKIIVDALVCHHPFWDKYNSFTAVASKGAAVFGNSSALEMTVNAILPSLYAAAKIGGSDSSLPLSVWLTLPATQSNRITKIAAARWFKVPAADDKLFKSAAACQGVLHLYREYCDKCHADCGACLIANSI